RPGVKLLTFQAASFRWQPFERSLPDEGHPPEVAPGEARDCVVVFLHAERRDEEPEERRTSVLQKTVKHVKWIAHKRGLRTVVLHSFTHLGGDTSSPAFARAFLDGLRARLENTGYDVRETPFGWQNTWGLDVYGESLAKVW